MKRKGFFQDMVYAIITAIIITSIAMIGIKSAISTDKIIRLNTVDMAGQRMEGAIYSLDGLGHGQIKIKYKDDYKVHENKEGDMVLTYSYALLSRSAKLDPPNSFNVEKEGEAESFCLVKDIGSRVSVKPGGCNG
ncbi:MAG: hypothetical protein ABEJ99_05860 [Candidatus Nanohaloarchaea archaeon]